MLGIYAATTRKTLSGQPIDGWFSEEVITVEDVLRACTYNGAYLTFADGIKGSLAPWLPVCSLILPFWMPIYWEYQ